MLQFTLVAEDVFIMKVVNVWDAISSLYIWRSTHTMILHANSPMDFSFRHFGLASLHVNGQNSVVTVHDCMCLCHAMPQAPHSYVTLHETTSASLERN